MPQNTASSKNSSSSLSAGIGGSSGGGVSGGSLGFSRGKGSSDSALSIEQSGIIFGSDDHSLTVTNHTNNTGGIIAHIQTDPITGKAIDKTLHFTTKTISNTDIQDHSTSKQSNKGTSKNEQSLGTTSINASRNGHILEQTTHATIGQGAVVTSDLINGEPTGKDSLAGVNRDINTATRVSKNQDTGGLNASVTIDNRLLSKAGRAEIAKEQENLGQNIENTAKITAAAGAIGVATVANVTKGMSLSEAFQAATNPTDIAAKIQKDPKLAAQIEAFKNGDYDNLAEAKAALASLAASTGEDAQILLTTILGNAKGATDARTNTTNGIIALDVNQANRVDILTTLGHELNHAAGSTSELGSDLIGWATNTLAEVATDANRTQVDNAKDGLLSATAAENAAVVADGDTQLLDAWVKDPEGMDFQTVGEKLDGAIINAIQNNQGVKGYGLTVLKTYWDHLGPESLSKVADEYFSDRKDVTRGDYGWAILDLASVIGVDKAFKVLKASRLEYFDKLEGVKGIGDDMLKNGASHEEAFNVVSSLRTELKSDVREGSGVLLGKATDVYDKARGSLPGMGQKFDVDVKLKDLLDSRKAKNKEEAYKLMYKSTFKTNKVVNTTLGVQGSVP